MCNVLCVIGCISEKRRELDKHLAAATSVFSFALFTPNFFRIPCAVYITKIVFHVYSVILLESIYLLAPVDVELIDR